MEFLVLVVAPIVAIAIVLYVCKKYKINFLPEEFRMKDMVPSPFKIPKINRKAKGKWIAEE